MRGVSGRRRDASDACCSVRRCGRCRLWKSTRKCVRRCKLKGWEPHVHIVPTYANDLLAGVAEGSHVEDIGIE